MSDLAPPTLDRQIAETKARVERSNADLLKTFSFVPEDRLAWSPGGESRSPLWLVGRCGASNEAFAVFLRGERPDLPSDPHELMTLIRDGGRETASREEAIASVESSVPKILAALDTVTVARLESRTETPFGPMPFGPMPFGPMPFSVWLETAWSHSYGHARPTGRPPDRLGRRRGSRLRTPRRQARTRQRTERFRYRSIFSNLAGPIPRTSSSSSSD